VGGTVFVATVFVGDATVGDAGSTAADFAAEQPANASATVSKAAIAAARFFTR
jgi:hypothetical protein